MKDKNMDSINKVEDEYTQSESANAENDIYYGVYIPNDFQSTNLNSKANVFKDKNSVLHLLKQYKRARFKAFNLFHEAVDFALKGSENPNSSIDYFSAQKTLVEAPQLLGEKLSPFKGPKPQDLIILRKAIEKGDYELVEQVIWKNPKYLISNGDTPSILQEGSRYNALHIAAKAKNSKMAELILNTVSNIEFVKLLYGDDSNEHGEDRTKVFLDLYLNTPDKGLNETPLHFSVKFGAVEVVELLVSYPQCDKTVKNKYGQTPSMIVCDRCEKPNKKLCERIAQLLDETFYVPVLRAEDNSVPPQIGEPFCPVHPPVFNTHPSSPRLVIQAYAGPMNKEGADHFRKVWKTPPRSLNINTPTKNLNNSLDNVASLKYKDHMKGLEIVGKTLATHYDVSWQEYWPFLDSFVDIASEEGLKLLENYFTCRVLDVSKSIASSSLGNSVGEKVNLNMSSISDLCQAFEAFNINSVNNSFKNSFQDELDSKISKNFSPFLCLEKACQVFACRFTNNILNAMDENLMNILDTEIKQLEIVVLSYMDDNRFTHVNFDCVHCRLSYLIAQKLYYKFSEEFEEKEIYNRIESLIESCTKSFDCFSSDDESVNFKDVPTKKGTSIKKQLLCLVHCILNHSNKNLEPICDNVTEQDCVRIWGELMPCACVLYARKSRRSSSLQRSNSRKLNSVYFSNPFRRLFGETEEINYTDQNCILDELYFTPTASPVMSDNEEEEFEDAKTLNDYDIFIECKFPSKTDRAVFNAMKYSGCDIDKDIYPNIYLWRHNVAQFSESERNRWKNHVDSFSNSPPSNTSTPQKINSPLTSTPTKSWSRITGINSPRNTKRSLVLSRLQ